jgi:2-C-methyl-D-erythritol 4-phosphate cytidylyltransferase
MKRYVLIVAGGKGLRMGGETPKQFMPAGGRPILMHTLERFYQWDAEAQLILVLPLEHLPYWAILCNEYQCTIPHQIVAGGETRFHSVRNGLKLTEAPGLTAVHDGVRPFVDASLIEACFDEAQRHGTAVPVVDLVDSIRERGLLEHESRPLVRGRYLAVQTPQVFRSDWLIDAYHQEYTPAFTDDASVIEAMGLEIHTLPGRRENIKITDRFDLLIAEALLHKPAAL